MTKIQIALVGKTAEPIKTGVRLKETDKLYLLPSKDTFEVAEEIKDDLKKVGYKNIEIKSIDAFELNSIVNTILKISEQEKHSEIFINITGGTNLMAGAATATAYFIGARAFYVRFNKTKSQEEGIYDIPIPRLPYFDSLGKKKIEILKKLHDRKSPVSQVELAREIDISAQATSRYVKVLEKMRFLTVKREKRDHQVSLTNEGRLAVEWNLYS